MMTAKVIFEHPNILFFFKYAYLGDVKNMLHWILQWWCQQCNENSMPGELNLGKCIIMSFMHNIIKNTIEKSRQKQMDGH